MAGEELLKSCHLFGFVVEEIRMSLVLHLDILAS